MMPKVFTTRFMRALVTAVIVVVQSIDITMAGQHILLTTLQLMLSVNHQEWFGVAFVFASIAYDAVRSGDNLRRIVKDVIDLLKTTKD